MRRIDHVAIVTADADRAAAWFVDTFGMRLIGDELVDSAGVRLLYLAPADADPDAETMLQFVQPVAAGAAADFLATRGEGLHHVCFGVDEIDEVLAAVGQEPSTIFMGGRERRACFVDRGTILVELTETQPWRATTPGSPAIA
jgi:methylmalonyl-CoA/ethylmalonyl-CoA epimerase